MKNLIVILLTVLMLLLMSCDLINPQDNTLSESLNINNDSIPIWYPSKLDISEDEFLEYDSVLNKFMVFYNIDRSNFERYGRDNICAHASELYIDPKIKIGKMFKYKSYEDNVIRVLNNFINDWWRLVSSDPLEIRSSHVFTNFHSVNIYPEYYYRYPVHWAYPGLGSIHASIDTSGYLHGIKSNIAPQLPVPIHPMVSSDSAENMLIGHEWYYYKSNGDSASCIVDSSDIDYTSLQVYIDRRTSEYLYRLIWCIRLVDSRIDFLIDAITGEYLTGIR